MTKGEMMNLVFTTKEISNVDSAIPMEYWDKVDTAIHVMDYNNNGCFGKLVNMEEMAKERNIELWK